MAKEKAKEEKIPRVYIPIPDPEEFLDVMGNPWTTQANQEPMDMAEVLLHTVRYAPVKTAEDAERALDIVTTLKNADGYIEMSQVDYEWMMRHLKETAHILWKAPDSAYLRRFIEKTKSHKKPGDSPPS